MTIPRCTPLVFLIFLMGCRDSIGPVATTPEDRILFVRHAGDAEEIYSVAPDGSGLTNLTLHPSRYLDLRLSPTGPEVAFYSDRGSCLDIWVMEPDGGELTQLTGVEADEGCNRWPRWSPDGSKIAFFSTRNAREGRGSDAYVVNADGTGLVYVGGNPSTDPETDLDVTHGWSPDGRVVVHSNRDGFERTYLVNADGSGMVRLFPDLEGFLEPYWSPSRQHVAIAVENGADLDLWVVGPDGSNGVDVSADPGWDYFPSWADQPWSPDGTWLAFGSSRAGSPDVWVVRPDGTGLTNVTDHSAHDRFHTWIPDGRMLISSDRDGDADLYLVNPDGSGLTKVLDDPGYGIGTAIWVPGGV
jgi:Tol biopolymer transport system component